MTGVGDCLAPLGVGMNRDGTNPRARSNVMRRKFVYVGDEIIHQERNM